MTIGEIRPDGVEPGSLLNSQGWKWGDPICSFDRKSYNQRVKDRIMYNLNKFDNKGSIWSSKEKRMVSEGVAEIAVNLRSNYCSTIQIVENSIGGPLGRLLKGQRVGDTEEAKDKG